MHKALGVYLLLKASCDGHMALSREQRLSIMAALEIRTVRSFNKYLDKLIQENWVGYDTANAIYYVRGFKSLRVRYGFYDYKAILFHVTEDSKIITEFVQAAIINNKVLRMVHARNAVIYKKVSRSALKKESAIQELVTSKRITPYCGLSNEAIGKLLSVSKSQADRIKKRLKACGYLKTKAKYNQVHCLSKPDFYIINQLPANRRYKFKKTIRKGIRTYRVMERTFDEIIGCMELSNQKSIVRRLKSPKKAIVE